MVQTSIIISSNFGAHSKETNHYTEQFSSLAFQGLRALRVQRLHYKFRLKTFRASLHGTSSLANKGEAIPF